MRVFGRNLNFPAFFIDSSLVINPACLDECIAEHLNAMHLERKVFIEQETCERLRRDLDHKTNTSHDSTSTFCQGDNVFYWRNNETECYGPAVVIAKDKQQVLVKHGGAYVIVHPFRLKLCWKVTHIPHKKINKSLDESFEDGDKDGYVTADDEKCYNFNEMSWHSVLQEDDIATSQSHETSQGECDFTSALAKREKHEKWRFAKPPENGKS